MRIIYKVLRLNTNMYTFLSGIFISASVGFYSAIRLENIDFNTDLYLYISALIMFVASIFWMILAVQLQPIQDNLNSLPKDMYDMRDEIWKDLIIKKKGQFVFYYLMAVILSVVSVVLLFL